MILYTGRAASPFSSSAAEPYSPQIWKTFCIWTPIFYNDIPSNSILDEINSKRKDKWENVFIKFTKDFI